MTDEQTKAIEYFVSSLATKIAMVRWEYDNGKTRWDSRELHDSWLREAQHNAALLGAGDCFDVQYVQIAGMSPRPYWPGPGTKQ